MSENLKRKKHQKKTALTISLSKLKKKKKTYKTKQKRTSRAMTKKINLKRMNLN